MQISSDIRSVRQLAVAVRDARIAKKLTQGELAAQTGLTRPWINQFEQGKTQNAGMAKVLLLCRTLDITLTVTYGDFPESPETTPAGVGTITALDTAANTIPGTISSNASIFDTKRLQESLKAVSDSAYASTLTKIKGPSPQLQELMRSTQAAQSPAIERYLEALRNVSPHLPQIGHPDDNLDDPAPTDDDSTNNDSDNFNDDSSTHEEANTPTR
jgi:HTH-type transcriptional regulator/antitoxin HipB